MAEIKKEIYIGGMVSRDVNLPVYKGIIQALGDAGLEYGRVVLNENNGNGLNRFLSRNGAQFTLEKRMAIARSWGFIGDFSLKPSQIAFSELVAALASNKLCLALVHDYQGQSVLDIIDDPLLLVREYDPLAFPDKKIADVSKIVGDYLKLLEAPVRRYGSCDNKLLNLFKGSIGRVLDRKTLDNFLHDCRCGLSVSGHVEKVGKQFKMDRECSLRIVGSIEGGYVLFESNYSPIRPLSSFMDKTAIQNGDIEIIIGERRVYRNGLNVDLADRGFRLLAGAGQNIGKLVPKKVITEYIWGEGCNVAPGLLRNQVRLVNEALKVRVLMIGFDFSIGMPILEEKNK